MNDPLTVSALSRDDSDMVRPDNNDADAGAAGIGAFSGPFPRQRQATVGFAEIPAHVSSAPGMCPVRMIMMMMGTSARFDRTRAQQNGRDSGQLQHSVLQPGFGI
jgi:hypothetical protein